MSTAAQLDDDPDAEFEDEIDPPIDDVEPEPEPPVSVEARARAQGWRPLAEFKGNPELWCDAPTFLQRGEEAWPVMRDQNRRMSERLARLEPEMAELRNTIAEQAQAVKDAMALARRSDERGYQRGLNELKAKQREAVEAGDTVAFDQVQEQIDAAQREREVSLEPVAREPAPKPAPPATPQNEIWPETTAFVEANPWFKQDVQLRQAMTAAHQAVLTLHPTIGRAASFEKAKRMVMESYPDRFEDEMAAAPPREEPPARPRRAASVLAPSNTDTGDGGRRRSAFEQIADPTEREQARAAFANMRKHDPEVTAEEYVALYINPHADVLDLRRTRAARK